MKLTWSAFALSDRDAIFTYIEADNPAAAVLIDEWIVIATVVYSIFLPVVVWIELLGHANSSSMVHPTLPPTPRPK